MELFPIVFSIDHFLEADQLAKEIQKQDASEDLVESGFHLGRITINAVIATICLLVCLSLVSYNQNDIHIINGGMEGYQINNWIGRLGAYVSSFFIEWIGLATFPIFLLILISAFTRICNPKVRQISWSYYIGFALVIIGTSLLLGVFPEQLNRFCVELNIIDSPGGALGQRFSSPDPANYGWMYYIVNSSGCIIITTIMISLGLFCIWYHDWFDLSSAIWTTWRKKIGPQEAETYKREDFVKEEEVKDEKPRMFLGQLQ